MISISSINAIVSASDRALGTDPADALKRAGADTCICSPQLDLWATLADRIYDVMVIVIGEHEVAPLIAYAPLHDDPRSRSIPCVMLLPANVSLDSVSAACLGLVALLPADCDEESLLRTVAELVAPRRKVIEYEQEVRELTDGLRRETRRADGLAKKLGNISHDLRGMLGVAYGFSCNLRDGVVEPKSEDERNHVRRILQAIEGATNLIEALLEIQPAISSRAPRSVPSMRPERVQRTLVQLSRLAGEVIALLEQKAASRNVRLLGDLDDGVRVWADALKLKQVVVNLVDNAIKYGSEGGEVTVRVEWIQPNLGNGKRSRRQARISVCDRGPGIPAELRERIFERGFRGDHDGPSSGHGIGLDLVREIVVQHGGSVQCDQAGEAGAAFHVSLPPDLRERDKPGLLVLRDGEAANLLVDLLEVPTDSRWRLAVPGEESEVTKLVRNCEAVVLLPTSDETGATDLVEQLRSTMSPGNETGDSK